MPRRSRSGGLEHALAGAGRRRVWLPDDAAPHSFDAFVTYSVAFMNRYVKIEAAPPVLTRKLPGVVALRVAAEPAAQPP